MKLPVCIFAILKLDLLQQPNKKINKIANIARAIDSNVIYISIIQWLNLKSICVRHPMKQHKNNCRPNGINQQPTKKVADSMFAGKIAIEQIELNSDQNAEFYNTAIASCGRLHREKSIRCFFLL